MTMSTPGVVVTNHAVTRFRERFRLLFNKQIFIDKSERDLLKILFKKSKPADFSLKMKVGLYNAICTKNRAKVQYNIYNDLVLFAFAEKEDGKRVVFTVLHAEEKIMGHSFVEFRQKSVDGSSPGL